MSPAEPATPTPNPRRRPVRRTVLLVLGGLLLIAIVYGGLKYRQWTTRPGYWVQTRQMLADMPADQKRQRAQSLMGRVTEDWNAFDSDVTEQELIESPDPVRMVVGDERTIVLPYDDLNILLEVEMPGILASQGAPLPEAFKGMMVTSDGDGRLIVAFEYDGPELNQVFSITMEVGVSERGVITSNLVRARGGELTLPRQQALERIADIVGGDREIADIRLMKLFTGEPFGPMDLPIDPGDQGDRDGRITGIDVRDDALHITRRTVARRPRPRAE